MRFAIQVNASPNQSYSGYSAYRFCKTALSQGHEVFRVFFYHDGIYHAFKYISPPDDEFQLTTEWGELAEQHKVDLVVCISAAQRRGLLYADEAERRNKQDDDVAAGFRIGGLGQWIEALNEADRVIVFG